MSFWTPKALGPLAQSESSGNPSLIHYPSGYTSSGARSSASGLYGYLDSTWQTYATQAGVDTSLYPRAYMAPADVQNQVALITPTSNWTCPGCNATASRLATDPTNVSDTAMADGPVDSSSGLGAGSSVSANPNGTSNFGDITNIPVAGVNAPLDSTLTGDVTPDAPNPKVDVSATPGFAKLVGDTTANIEKAFGSGLAAAVKSFDTFASNAIGGVSNWFLRGALLIFGIILAAIALIVLLWDHGGKETAQSAMKLAAA